ncbi:hypothetical protein LCGC14_1719720, partial [marine sediment metagenome]
MSKCIKILFIYPNGVLQNPPPISVAIFYALLKDKNVEIKLFDISLYDLHEKSYDKKQENRLQVRPFVLDDKLIGKIKRTDPYKDLQEIVYDFCPDLIAMSCNEVSYSTGLSFLESIENHNGLTIVGGPFSIFAPEEVLKNDCVDMV